MENNIKLHRKTKEEQNQYSSCVFAWKPNNGHD